MVIVENRGYLVAHYVPCLSDSNIQGEDGLQDSKDKQMNSRLDETPNSQSRLSLRISLYRRLFHRWKMFLE